MSTHRDSEIVRALRSALRPGATVALGDGIGQLRCLDNGQTIAAALSILASEIGSVRMVLGWLPAPAEGIESGAFSDVVALMPGWGVRNILASGAGRFAPTRLSGIKALLAGPLRPDVLVTRVVERDGGLRLTTEVSWQRDLIDAGVLTFAVVDRTAPCADAGPPLPDNVRVAGSCEDGPLVMPPKEPEPLHEALADAVLQFVEAGTRLQYGPGQLGTALLRRTAVPLRIDTGLLTDAAVDLDRRGLMAGLPSATYLLGSEELYDWANGHPILHSISYTHDVTRLSSGDPFVAVNTAIEIDPFGQINVEGVGEKVIGGIGGHPDYCAAGAMSQGGLSIIAVPSCTNGRSPLVPQLSRPVSTPAYDVDLIVTESGHADLRGADWTRRQHLITNLFE